VIDFLKASKKASEDATETITFALRSYLAERQWPTSAANSVQVIKNSDKYELKFEGPDIATATLYEYGSELERPRADVRRFLSNSEFLSEILMSHLEKELGELA
jgi:hypothetical protein